MFIELNETQIKYSIKTVRQFTGHILTVDFAPPLNRITAVQMLNTICLNIQISQRSAATDLRSGGKFYPQFITDSSCSLRITVTEIGPSLPGLHYKHQSGRDFFVAHDVYGDFRNH